MKKILFKKASSTKTYSGIYHIESIDNNAYYLNGLKKPFRGHELIEVGDAQDEPVNEYLNAVAIDDREQHTIREHRREGIEATNIINEPRVRKPNPRFV